MPDKTVAAVGKLQVLHARRETLRPPSRPPAQAAAAHQIAGYSSVDRRSRRADEAGQCCYSRSWRIALLERFWQARHPPRYAAYLIPSSPSFPHSSRLTRANGDGPLPSLHEHYTRFIATTKQSAPARRIGTFGLAVQSRLRPFLWHRRQVLTFRPRAWLSLRRLHAGCRLGRLRASPRLIPEEGSPPGFDIV